MAFIKNGDAEILEILKEDLKEASSLDETTSLVLKIAKQEMKNISENSNKPELNKKLD